MTISVFDLFTIGIGPSSSHTVGPMRAALRFVRYLREQGTSGQISRVQIELFGSLGATGEGHGTDKAVLLGLMGETPETVDIDTIPERLRKLQESQRLVMPELGAVTFDPAGDLLFTPAQTLPEHPNGIRFRAWTHSDGPLERTYYSIGGGFVVEGGSGPEDTLPANDTALPHPFHSARELLALCAEHHLRISDLMLANEKVWRSTEQIHDGLHHIWRVMRECIERGCRHPGVLPGGLSVKRRAPGLYRQLQAETKKEKTPLGTMDWVNLYAMAVNEENAAGGRVVTAPTNGAAGIIPAVLRYYLRFWPGASEDEVPRFLLTAGAIGILYKENASISGAEVGCQGEIGSACSMAAAALTEVAGGTPSQVENAAEIAMEHNLGLTCDPVGGLVQVPCIERNCMGAVKAINASRIALRGDGHHHVSLDQVIKTMRDTGADMKSQYKETSLGGLAVNVIEC